MRFNYSTDVKVLIAKKIIEKEDVFYYDSITLEQEYDKIYQFYKETLRLNSHFGINPSHFYFSNSFERNAKAGRKDRDFVITINLGAIAYLHKTFQPGNSELLNLNLNKSLIGTDINTLMYQFAIHFTFYHELAHLIQMTNSVEDSVEELVNLQESYNERKHLLELDADAYSSLCLGSHVIQLYENNFSQTKDLQDLIELLSAMCATAFNYVLSFNQGDRQIYFKEHSHPHPVIRISCITQHILEYVQQSIGKDKFTDNMRKAVMHRSFALVESIYGNEPVKNYIEILQNNTPEIMEYVAYFRTLDQDPSLAVNRWNASVI